MKVVKQIQAVPKKLVLGVFTLTYLSCNVSVAMAGGVDSSGNCTNAPVSGKKYFVINQSSGKALDIGKRSTKDYADVIQWDLHKKTNQQFTLTDLGNGHWSMIAAHSEKSLDVQGWSKNDGANIHQYSYTGHSNQQWKIAQSSSGAFNITSKYSGKAISVGSDDNGASVKQQTASTSPYQHWYLNRVDGECPNDSSSTPEPAPAPKPKPISNSCPTGLTGFASVKADGLSSTTGGGNAKPTKVTTLAELKAAVGAKEPRVVVVSGTIDTGTDPVYIASNKTLMGADKNATIKGGLKMKRVSNIIIRNLNIHGKWPAKSPADAIESFDSHHIWYDHLNIWDAADGLLDITRESSYQTVSWTKFWYTDTKHTHRLASLNGNGGGTRPKDYGRLKITYHHNWWAKNVDQRMPRVMYGQGHQFNNFFNSVGNSYCIGVGSYGSILVENNYFKDVKNPHGFMYDVYMHAKAEGNIYDNTKGRKDTGYGGNRHVDGQESFKAGPFTPPYSYTMDAAKDIPDLVKRCAGPQ